MTAARPTDRPRPAQPVGVSVRDLLASCAAAAAVSRPPRAPRAATGQPPRGPQENA